jgi:hypothetical protein
MLVRQSLTTPLALCLPPPPRLAPLAAGVYTDGKAYGVAEGLIFSLPLVTERGGAYKVVTDLSIDDFSKGKLTCVPAAGGAAGVVGGDSGRMNVAHMPQHPRPVCFTSAATPAPFPSLALQRHGGGAQAGEGHGAGVRSPQREGTGGCAQCARGGGGSRHRSASVAPAPAGRRLYHRSKQLQRWSRAPHAARHWRRWLPVARQCVSAPYPHLRSRAHSDDTGFASLFDASCAHVWASQQAW